MNSNNLLINWVEKMVRFFVPLDFLEKFFKNNLTILFQRKVCQKGNKNTINVPQIEFISRVFEGRPALGCTAVDSSGAKITLYKVSFWSIKSTFITVRSGWD